MSDSPSSGNHSTDGRTRVAVIFGGTSSEHAVSCLTAGGVLKALDPARYDVLGVGITRSGRWVLRSEEHTSELQSRQYLVCRLLLEKKKQLQCFVLYKNSSIL